MDKTFDPAAVERRISALWEESRAFEAGRPDRAAAEPFTIVIPPPNVTGVLHMGHALNNTLQDILCRFERMRGRDVLWQPGTDHAGIATQMVVERQLAERQEPGRRAMGREKFLQRVWQWKQESGGAIVNQLRRLGASCDWSRERFTMDEGLSHAVRKVFVALHREGLIYRDKRLVNWDPKLLTAVSDIEVVPTETKGHLWHFRYPIVDEAGAPTGESIVVATTRPETMLGDTGVAVHPEDERYTHLVGKRVKLPLVGRPIPIVADSYSDPEKGTGAVKITPAHDFNDFEVGRRHDLALINILDAEARLLLQGNGAFFAGIPDAAEARQTALHLHGLSREEARKRIVEMMDEAGLLEKVEAHAHAVPHGDRSGVVIEPWLTDQWYVDAKTMAQPALAAVRGGKMRFVPKQYENTYFAWLDNIQPWCISRQLWWGHQIPAWYAPDGTIFVEETEAAAQAAADAKFGAPTKLVRDEDVLDTWFSSALWPFSTLGWPDDLKDVERYYPTSVLVTGFDIIFFWVARMMMMGLHFLHEVPFHEVYMHALVRDERGQKMSKSKGNVLDPLDFVDGISLEALIAKRTIGFTDKKDVDRIASATRKDYPDGIDRFGADALRFTLAAMAVQGRDIKLSVQRVDGYRSFATKIWNAARFGEVNGCVRAAGYDPHAAKVSLNRWVLSEVAKAHAELTAAIETYRFNDAAGAAYRFAWNVFCDWYVELAKPLLQGEADPAEKAETQATFAFVLDEIVKLLHPFMPFVTEELWAIKGAEGPKRESVLALAPWSDLSGLEDREAEAEIGWMIDLVSEIRSVRSEMGVPVAAQVPLVLVGADAATGRRADRWGDTVRRMARLSAITLASEAPPQSVQIPVRGSTAALPLEGVIDFAAERARLAKEIAKLKGEEAKIEGKLGNADFLARAPEEVVDEQRERLAEAQGRRAKLEVALSRLG
ncbi:Valine--tRNA ligase [Beijerinckiaceae bacterium RH AL1]|nr:valine--tRNA ligase [Beijerinckiaceae bacterium]VVB45962.1 Valine--tRNA ligase [Beijerinckiaceae bacterium RH CH11]VVB46042.1 Valine--tRNA ligase [Beijerinckiaceae bacterium RH AL8]VVC55130.1 Valine--tRNA ligase [Beijerinckiaceae bacterium RH AL1]